ncbi:MAG: hypothetical protein U0X93_00430 [Anaerolineales bacterium]
MGSNTLFSPDPSIRNTKYAIDVFFPILHGTFGEDGTIQGLFEMADVAYVGAGVVGSAVGMDKGVFKEVMRANEIPVVESVLASRNDIQKNMNAVIEKAEKAGAYPLFTKPANLGSSVGVTKCHNRSDLQEGLMEAASFDRRVLVERGVVDAREIEVSVLGNDEPVASVCVEKCCRAASFIRTNRNTLTAHRAWRFPLRCRRKPPNESASMPSARTS